MARQEMTVAELVADIERGRIKKPEMQREYVWQAPRVRDLLDSLYRGYPSGTILLWDSREEVATADFALKTNRNSVGSTLLLLDGQQRLTSLSSVIRGEPIVVRSKKRLRPIDILFNLEHPDELLTVTEIDDSLDDFQIDDDDDDDDEETLQDLFNQFTFIVSNNQLASLPTWVNVSEVFKSSSDAEFLERAGVTSLKDPKYKKYSERLQKLRAITKYVYRLDVLEHDLSYEEVTEIFVRVNSLGVKLRSSDLALAQITSKWRDSLKLFQEFQEKCFEDQGFFFDTGIYVRNMVIFATGQSRFKSVSSISLDNLRSSWTNGKKGIEFAINFLVSNVGINSPALLTSPFIVLTLSYWGHLNDYKISSVQARNMKRWVLIANTKSRYSTSAEQLLDQDLAILKSRGTEQELIDRLSAQFGRLDVNENDLIGRRSSSGYFRAMYLAFLEDGAKDWTTNLKISLRHTGSEHKLQFHHIFPKAFLKIHYPHLRRTQINDIANLAFIGGKTNRQISDKAPQEYLSKYIEKDPLQFQHQCIPIEPALLGKGSFDEFIQERRKLIANRINELLS
jgi:hypothetical protein